MTTASELGEKIKARAWELERGWDGLVALVDQLVALAQGPAPAGQPMTRDDINAIYRACRITFCVPDDCDRYPTTWTNTDEMERLIRAVEAHHGITKDSP